ncbi:MAG: S-layer homology domain-containing protein, partial [Oscillospiraceae bacterium]|nr:S-layer homology domain-containing protein [Oscillospiraceae bacterium]
VFLADTGDTVQGTPLTYYFAFEEDTMEDPTAKVLRTLDYDMWVLGNHEFNYGLKILNEQMDYATAAPTEGEDTVGISVANYLAAETNNDTEKDWATWRGYAPYVIKDYDGVKVAIMGIGNPNIPKWDVPANWEGIYFASPIETYEHYEEEMKAQADLIVIMSHSGIDSDAESDYIRELIETHDSIALAYTGHEHRNGVTNITDKSGKVIPVVSPYTKADKIARTLITFDKATGEYTIVAENISMRNYAIDEETAAMLKPYEDATWNDYMLQPIGKASGDFSASNLGTAPSAFMDLINQVQMYYAHDYNGENTPDDPTDDTPAQLSISAPLTSGNAANLIPEGDIVLGDMFRLYRYENWFYQITMNGKEVRTWLEFAATKIKTDENGNPTVSSGDLTYYDVIYGEGFSYTIDYTKPEGQRIVSMTYNGAEVKDTDTFTAVVNNYRYNGGGNYVSYLQANGCEDFIANDEARVIYSTQYDMIQGEDQGQARNMLANYIRMKGTIDPEITSTWKLVDGTEVFDNPFTDIIEGTWYYEYVLEAAKLGLVNGMKEDIFAPDANLTRAQFVTILYRLLGSPSVEGMENVFTDLEASWYKDAVIYMNNIGAVKGATDTTFDPNTNITREQLVTILYRLSGEKYEKEIDFSAFADGDKVSVYAKEAMAWAIEAGFVNGITSYAKPGTYLEPQGMATRAQAAKIVLLFAVLG